MRKISRMFVEVDIDTPFTSEKNPDYEKKWYREARDFIESIQRHCDGFTDTNIEREYACEFCGDTEDYGKEQPQCCDKAQKEWEEKQEVQP